MDVKIKNVCKGNPVLPIKGISVQLYEKDTRSPDDFLGESITNEDGEAIFRISINQSMDMDDSSNPHIPIPNPPEFYVNLFTINKEFILSTKGNISSASIIIVPIPDELCIRFNLLPKKGQKDKNQKMADLMDLFNPKKPGTKKLPGCIAGLILETIAGLDKPQNYLQKELYEASKDLREREPQAFKRTISSAREAHYFLGKNGVFENCKIPEPEKPEDIARFLMNHDPDISNHIHAFAQQIVPTYEKKFSEMTPSEGFPFKKKSDKVKGCYDVYETDGIGEGPEYILPPRVNRISIMEPLAGGLTGHEIRYGDPHSKMLQITSPAPGSSEFRNISMNVSLESDGCVFSSMDSNNRQNFIMDVKPGHQILLQGSGFIDDEVLISASHYIWNVDASGRIDPQDRPQTVAGLHNKRFKVFGSSVAPTDRDDPSGWNEDQILLIWPEEISQPGVYEIKLSFRNGNRFPTHISQDNRTCEFLETIPDYVEAAQKLWFVILNEPDKKMVKYVVDRVKCIDLTNPLGSPELNFPWGRGPEAPWPDTIALQTNASVTGMMIDMSNSIRPISHVDLIPFINSLDEKLFFRDGDEKSWPVMVIPNDPSFQLMQDMDFMNTYCIVSEVEGALDRAALFIAANLVVLAIFLLLLAAVFGALIYFGVAAIAAAPIVVQLAIIFGPTFFVTLPGVFSAVIAAIPAGDAILHSMAVFPGHEIRYRMSGVRFHRLFYGEHTIENMLAGSSRYNMSFHPPSQPTEIRFEFDDSNEGGQYKLFTRLLTHNM